MKTDPRTPARSRWRRYGLQVLLFAAVYLMVTEWQTRHTSSPGAAAPAFTLTSSDGRSVSLAELRGKRVLLHFWATWCGVCQREFEMLNRLQQGLSRDQILLSVVVDAENAAAVRQAMVENAIEYPVLLANERITRDYGVTVLPTNYVIDARGHVTSVTSGMSTRWGLGRRLDCAGRMP